MKSTNKAQHKRRKRRYDTGKYEVRVYTKYFTDYDRRIQIIDTQKYGYRLCYSNLNLIKLRQLLQIAYINNYLNGAFVRIYEKHTLVRLVILDMPISEECILKKDSIELSFYI